MTEAELTYLGEEASKCQTVVEVGSYAGRSTKMLALSCPGVVYSVDNLKGVHWHGQRLDRMFRFNLSEEIESGKVVVIREPSVEAAERFESVDMVFIDADHDYPAPLRDLEAWFPKARLVCGHDYSFKDVRRSLDEFGRPHEQAADGIWRLT